MKDVLSTRELAEAIGVSESSIKRWADDGVLHAARTAGGHRRIPLAEAIRFIRETGAAVVQPAILGLDDAAGVRSTRHGDGAESLYRFLAQGAAPEARGLIQSLYLAGHPVATIVDGPVREALRRIGEQWRHRDDGILCEHRAVDLCVQALSQLRSLFPESAEAALAVGGAPSGDPYILPSLAAATVLAAEGFRTVNLGPETPFDTLALAAVELRPRIVWLSVSLDPLPDRLAERIPRFAERVRPHGASVVVGGRTLPATPFPAVTNLHVGRSMAELAAFARGLAAAIPAGRAG